jgi:hypothetical protein
LIMHDSYFAKVAGRDKFYLDKTLLTVAALFYSEIIIRKWLEPGVSPEKRHIFMPTTYLNGYFSVYLCLSIISYMRR